MAIDFDALVAPTRGTRFSTLRPAQREALRLYATEAHALADIGIELPTGAGKTLIALLVLEFWRKQGKRVAILTGNKTLARQIEAEAKGLKVPVVRLEGRGDLLAPGDLRAYNRSRAIAVMNYWVYINQNPSLEPADIVVLDDAQLAETALASLFSVRIGRHEHEELYDAAMKLFAQYTDSLVADDHVKGMDRGPTGPTDLVAFPDFLAAYDELEALVESHIQEAPDDAEWKDLRFRWGRVRPKARQALVFLSNDEILLRPYIYPTQDFTHLAAPGQRIYMSATLHDPDDLQRRLGTPPMTKLDISADLVTEDDGRRLFIFNQSVSPSSRTEPPEGVLVPLAELLIVAKKSVWLCSSRSEARRWRKWLVEKLGAAGPTPVTWELTPTGDELEEFLRADAGHLFIAGRFEGMDFAGDTCRLAVFPSLPRATGALERFVTEQLKDAAFQKTRMLERIKQGIGRCSRGHDDYAVYFFLDPRFYAEMDAPAFAGLQNDRTRRQVELGLELTEEGMGAVVPFATKFLRGVFRDFDERELAARPPAVPAASRPTGASTVDDEVDGWRSLFERRDFTRAAASFEKVSRGLADAEREHRGFWKYMEALAEYLRYLLDEEPGAREACLGHLERAIVEGGSSSWFNRLRKSKNRLAGASEAPPLVDQSAVLDRWDELVERYPHYKGRFLRWQAALKALFDGTHNQVCEGLQTLGHLLGLSASRPVGNGVADGLWVDRDYAITLEAKIEVNRDDICLADVNQADGHRRAMTKELGLSAEQVAPVIVTGMSGVDDQAVRALGAVRVLSLDLVHEIMDRLEATMRTYWKGWSREDAGIRSKLRSVAAKKLPPPGWLLRAIRSSKSAFITEEDLFKEWPR